MKKSVFPPAKRWETLFRALRDRGYAIVVEGGGQRIVRVRSQKREPERPETRSGGNGANGRSTASPRLEIAGFAKNVSER